MRHKTWRDRVSKLKDRVKTRHTIVETEPRPRREKPYLEIVWRQDMCLQDSITG